MVALGEGLETQLWRVFGYLLPVLGTVPRLRDGLLSIMLARLGGE